MSSLAVRRNILDLKFLFKLVNGYIDCPEQLSFINFYVPRRQIRNTYTFHNHLHRTNYTVNSPLNRTTRLANDTQIDFFNIHSIESFCYYIIRYYL